jgi:hypothetical protein
MPRFLPTEEERALVKLLIANGYAQHLVCKCISNRRGSYISESTLKRAFAPNGYAQHLVCKCISNRRGSHISESTLKRAFAQELVATQRQKDLRGGHWLQAEVP